MKHISKILLATYVFVFVTSTWVFISLVVGTKNKENHKPDTFQCPHCDTKLKWSELGRGYIECRSGWTAATPNPVYDYKSANALAYNVEELRLRIKRLEDKIETMFKPISIEDYIATNRIWITRDPLDNMPMIGMDQNGAIIPL